MDKKILIIDDEDNIRMLLKVVLREIAEIHDAENGAEGMLKFEQVKPDLVILDIMLPDTSGVELLQQIREKNKEVKVLMLTAYDTIKETIEMMNIEISGYLTKPFENEEVRKKIKRLLKIK